MRTSNYILSTKKESPNNAEIISHQLMLRAGMIRQLSSGLYTWLPTGLRVLKKIENIIRKEMNKIGALEISMPIVQPAALWKKSGRWTKYGTELLKFIDRNTKSFVLGPTHEEVVSDIICNEIKSYKQLPIHIYQIQTKFRDEIRPKFGVIRSREFVMKDSYSFHIDTKSLKITYENMYQTYNDIFNLIGLKFRIIEADNGVIGGNISHEFQSQITPFIPINKKNKNNITIKKIIEKKITPNLIKEKIKLVKIPSVYDIQDLVRNFHIPIDKITKIIIVHSNNKNNNLIGLMLRGDHKLNNKKVEKLLQISTPLKFASEEEIRLIIGSGPNALGPINLPIPLIIDYNVATMNNFIAGANIDGKYFFGINWERDLPLPTIADLRDNNTENFINLSKEEIISPIIQNIEIGHIFQLGDQYSSKIKSKIQNKDGHKISLSMGCYGIGITRIIAAIIEQNHDHHGIIWPEKLAPFNIAILPINMHNSVSVYNIAEDLYSKLRLSGIDVLLDDRNETIGVMFNDAELIGIPHIIVINEEFLNTQEIEYNCRNNKKKERIKLNNIINFLLNKTTS